MPTKPGEIYWAAISEAFDAVDATDTPAKFDTQMARWPLHIRHLLAVHWCDAEVCNGGFAQLFWNTTGIFAPIAAEACRAMKQQECADVIEEAMQRLGEAFLRNREAREALLDKADPDFDDLNTRWFGHFPKKDGLNHALYVAMDKYAGAHAGKK